tara:strand:- start:616 stop:1200 length:585 start_codon:yes stop_codon:yes gene_type:complete
MKSLNLEKSVDSNLKPVKDLDGSLTGLELSTNKTRTKSLDVIGDLNVFGSITTSTEKHISIINTGFYHSASTQVYIPLNGYVFEQTTTSSRNEFVAMITPFSGRVLKVFARSEAATGTTTVRYHKSSDGTEVPNTTQSATVAVDMPADDTTAEFDFRDKNNTFDAGDIVAFSFEPTNPSYDTNVTVVLEYEVTK